MVAAFFLGSLVPPALLVLRYATIGEWSTLRYYYLTYNSSVYMAPFSRAMVWNAIWVWTVEHAMGLFLAFAALGWCLFEAFRDARRADLALRWDQRGMWPTIALTALLSLFGGKIGLREFPHYYVTAVPWFALLGAHLALPLVERAQQSIPRARTWFAALLFAWVFGLAIRIADYDRKVVRGMGSWAPLCEVVQALAKPRDPIFIWGFQPWLYIDCDRRPASRYVFTTFLMGFAPFIPQEPEVERARIVAGSHETLLAELTTTKPPVILDIPIGWRSMDAYPDLAAFLHERYCVKGDTAVSTWGGPHKCTMYVPRREDGSCQ